VGIISTKTFLIVHAATVYVLFIDFSHLFVDLINTVLNGKSSGKVQNLAERSD
jgi:hypothetical protein